MNRTHQHKSHMIFNRNRLQVTADRTKRHRGNARRNAHLYRAMRTGLFLLLLGGFFFGRGPGDALAYNDKGQDWIKFPTVTVVGNGQTYTGVKGTGYGWEGRFWLTAGWNARVKGWRVWPKATALAPDGSLSDRELSLSLYDARKTYALFERPKKVNRTVGTLAPGSAYGAWAAGACNDRAEHLRSTGKSNQWIFSRDHEVDVYAMLHIDPEFSAGKMWAQEASPIGGNTKIICKKWSGAQIPTAGDLKVDNSVKTASLTVMEQYGPGGLCQLTLSGVIETAHPHTLVKFHYAGNNGNKTGLKTVTTDHSRTVFFSHKYQIDNNPDGEETGSVRIEGVSTSFETPWKNYRMACEAPSATGLVAELPPKLNIQVTPVDNVLVDGQICPSRLQLQGTIEARSDLDAQMLFLGSNFLSPVHQVDQNSGQTKSYIDFRDLKWQKNTPLGLTAGQQGPSSMRSQQVQIGFNVFKADRVIASVPRKNYRITCKPPQKNKAIGGSTNDLSPNVAVLQSNLVVIPQTSKTGKCAVKLTGSVATNVANAKVTFSYRNHMGIRTSYRTVTTNALKRATFQDTLDFSKSGKGLWVDQSGKIGMQRGSQAGNYSGYFELVGTRPVFQSSQAQYDFSCVNQAPDGLAKNPPKPKPAISPVGPLTSAPKDTPQTSAKKPDQFAAKKKTPKSVSAKQVAQKTTVVVMKPIRDIAVEDFNLRIRPRKGTATGVIVNRGTVKTTFRYTLVVRTGNGKRVDQQQSQLTLDPGSSATVKKTFQTRRGKHYAGSLSVAARGDNNSSNNIQKAQGPQ